MKQQLSYTLITILLAMLTATSISFAQETTTGTTTGERIQENHQAIIDTRKNIKTLTQENHIETETTREKTLQTIDVLRTQITKKKTDITQELSAIYTTAQIRLADMPAWINGVCQSTKSDTETPTSCETIRTALKEKCATLKTAVANTSDKLAIAQKCTTIDTLSCTDITNTCAKVQEAVQNHAENIDALRARITEKSTDVAQKLEEHKSAFTAKLTALTDKAKERIQAYGVRIAERITAAFDRLGLLIDRIESRITKIKTKHPKIDLSVAITSLASARNHIQNGRDILATATNTLPDALVGDDARNATDVVRETFAQAAEEARAAKDDIVSALNTITTTLANANISITETTE